MDTCVAHILIRIHTYVMFLYNTLHQLPMYLAYASTDSDKRLRKGGSRLDRMEWEAAVASNHDSPSAWSR